MPRSKPHDKAMAELYRSDPGLALEVLRSIVTDGGRAELPGALRQMAGASVGVAGSPVIESLRGELAALHRAGAIGPETVQAFEALLSPDKGGDLHRPL